MAASTGLPELPVTANPKEKETRLRRQRGGPMVSLVTQWSASGSAHG